MSEAPKRIWAYTWHQYTSNNGSGQTEYIRADIILAFMEELNHAYDNGNHSNTTGIGDALAIAMRHFKPTPPTPPKSEP
jgi:hypothetical protein